MKKYFNLQLFETDAQIIDRSGAESLIPEDRAAEIIQGAIAQSAVLSMGRRLANMTAAQTRLPVLDALPIAYFVNGDTGRRRPPDRHGTRRPSSPRRSRSSFPSPRQFWTTLTTTSGARSVLVSRRLLARSSTPPSCSALTSLQPGVRVWCLPLLLPAQ